MGGAGRGGGEKGAGCAGRPWKGGRERGMGEWNGGVDGDMDGGRADTRGRF